MCRVWNIKQTNMNTNEDEKNEELEPIELDQVSDALHEIDRENARAIGILL